MFIYQFASSSSFNPAQGGPLPPHLDAHFTSCGRDLNKAKFRALEHSDLNHPANQLSSFTGSRSLASTCLRHRLGSPFQKGKMAAKRNHFHLRFLTQNCSQTYVKWSQFDASLPWRRWLCLKKPETSLYTFALVV